MSQSQMRERYNVINQERQNFKSYVAAEIQDCKRQLSAAAKNAAKDVHGKLVFYVIARHVSKSGMSRILSLHYFDTKAGRMYQLNYVASVLLELSIDRTRDGVIVKGCGMDMGFDLVYQLSHIAMQDGYTIRHEWL